MQKRISWLAITVFAQLGIDTLFNFGSYVPPTRLRIVAPTEAHHDRASVTLDARDFNGDGDTDEPYESGTIFKNTTEDVPLTVTVHKRSVHPVDVKVEYMDADGAWQEIGVLEVGEGEPGANLQIEWDVTDFDALVAAGDTVQVRAVATNDLQLRDDDPMVLSINLDDDVHPVDPVVLAVDVDADSIIKRNQDSGAPQGTINLIGYSPRRTLPRTVGIRVEAKRMKTDEDWTDLGAVRVEDGKDEGMEGEETAGIDLDFKDKTLGEVYAEVYADAEVQVHIDPTSSYLKWVVTVDTTALADTITKDSPAAHALALGDYVKLDDNRYMVRAYAVGEDGSDISVALEGDNTEMFSVDNVDDVAPLGPTNVMVDGIDAVDGVLTSEDGSYTVGGLVDKHGRRCCLTYNYVDYHTVS